MIALAALVLARTTSGQLSKAEAQALASHRCVFAVFEATWCRSCKDLKSFLAKPSVSQLLQKKLVVTYLDVSDDKQTMNLQLRTQYCSPHAPMPAYAIIDGKGKLIANGFGNSPDPKRGTVLSYPLNHRNMPDFLRMLHKVPNGFDNDTLWKIRTELEKVVR